VDYHYHQQRGQALGLHRGKCPICGQVISEATGFHTHHLLISKGHVRNRDLKPLLDEWINLCPLCANCHPDPAHTREWHDKLCQIQYRLVGDGDAQIGYAICYNWCKTILTKTEPDIPAPEEDHDS